MIEILSNPLSWIFGVILVPSVVGTVAHYLTKAQRDRLDAELKMQMLERGMSADEIERVLSAKSGSKKNRESSPVSV
jgi:hypothetical protein